MDQIPQNAPAHLVVAAQSVIRDLTQQGAEITLAIARQQDLIEGLMPAAVWATPDPAPPTTQESPAE